MRESDSGAYLCMAKNTIGSILTTTQVTVRGIIVLRNVVLIVVVAVAEAVSCYWWQIVHLN